MHEFWPAIALTVFFTGLIIVLRIFSDRAIDALTKENYELFQRNMRLREEKSLLQSQLEEMHQETTDLITTLLKSKLASAVMSEIRRNGPKMYSTACMEEVKNGKYDDDGSTVEQEATEPDPKIPGGAEGEA